MRRVVLEHFNNSQSKDGPARYQPISIPKTADEVEIKNVVSPYYMIAAPAVASELESEIGVSLRQYILENGLEDKEHSSPPKSGDFVAVLSSRMAISADLPSYTCRGQIMHCNDVTLIYTILLVDYGLVLELSGNEFVIIPKHAVKQEPLCFVISVDKVLPASYDETQQIAWIKDYWSVTAIKFSHYMINIAEKVYFNKTALDIIPNTFYGEVYLIINGQIRTLSSLLVSNLHAVRITGDLLEYAKNTYISLRSIDTRGRVCMKKNQLFVEPDYYSRHYIINMVAEGEEANNENSLVVNQEYPVAKNNLENHSLMENRQKEVLVFSSMKCKRINDMAEAKIDNDLFKQLREMGVDSPRDIQTYLWPAISEGFDTVAIGFSKCGKTFGYVVPLLNFLITEFRELGKVESKVLVLTSTSDSVLKIQQMFNDILGRFYKIRTAAAFKGLDDKAVAVNFYNGHDVLISTPNFLCQYMNKYKTMISFKEFRYLVLDKADEFLDNSFTAWQELISAHNMLGNRDKNRNNLPMMQIIIAAETFTKSLRKLVTITYYPYVCIKSFIEVAAFKQTKVELFARNKEAKNNQLLELIKDEYTSTKVMIICKDDNEVSELNEFLISKNVKTLTAHNGLSTVHTYELNRRWDAYLELDYPVLICCDNVLPEVRVKSAQWLIHYTLPETNKTQFCFRFSCLTDRWENNEKCRITIFIDETNKKQLGKIYQMMKRFHAQIPEGFEDVVKRVALQLEEERNFTSLCNYVKFFGECQRFKESRCMGFKHKFFKEIDRASWPFEAGDTVRLLVTFTHNANHFSARIINYKKQNERRAIDVPKDTYLDLYDQMSNFYLNTDNLMSVKDVRVDQMYACQNRGVYERAKILKLINNDDEDKPKHVIVKFIDEGSITRVPVFNLKVLPEKFANWECHIVDVVLSEIAPPDNELNWNSNTKQFAVQWLKKNLSENSYVTAEIKFSRNRIIWVDTLKIFTKLLGRAEFMVSSIKQEILDRKLGVENPNHLEKLHQLVTDSGIDTVSN